MVFSLSIPFPLPTFPQSSPTVTQYHIVNKEFLLRPEVFGGLHCADYIGGLQFVGIWAECVWLTAFTFSSEEFGLARNLISERWLCSASTQ
jgi:hypothetical protein